MKFAIALISMLLLSVAGTALLAPEPTRAVTIALPPSPAWPVVRGNIRDDPERWYVAFEQRRGVELCPLEPSDYGCQQLEGVFLSDLKTPPLGTWTQRIDATVPASAMKHSEYVSQLVAGSRARLGDGFDRAIEDEVQRGVAANLRRSDAGVSPEIDPEAFDAWTIAWAREHREDDALFEAFGHHVSTGSCSYDGTPNFTAQLFAELALARGDRATFVELQLRLISNAFERAAWSTGGHDSPRTHATRLLAANVDLDELFLGLVIRHPGAKGSVDDRRLARAIRETGQTNAMLPKVEALATDESLDAYNRFRATEVWLHLQVYDAATEENLAAVKKAAASLNLHPISRMRVDRAR